MAAIALRRDGRARDEGLEERSGRRLRMNRGVRSGDEQVMGELPDAAVIVRSQREPEVFGVLFDRYFAVIHAYLERRVGRDLADDLAGEVFRVAFQRRGRFRPLRETAGPWLYGIASRLVLREGRSELRRLRALGRLDRGETEAESGVETAADRVDAASLRLALFGALSRLEARDRAVLLLVAWEGLSYEEVAAALEVPVGTVRSRLNRARTLVRGALAAGEGEAACLPLSPSGGDSDAR